MGELNTFPVSYKVKGQRIVIVGGGEEALNKARLALKTTASVVIISDNLTADFSGVSPDQVSGSVWWNALDNAALVFIAEKSEVAELVKAEARRRGIPVNVVDTPDECDFYVPSTVSGARSTIEG